MNVKSQRGITFTFKDILYGIVTIGAIVAGILKGGAMYKVFIDKQDYAIEEIVCIKNMFIDYRIANDKKWEEETGSKPKYDEYIQSTGHPLRSRGETANLEVKKNKEKL
jgi:hypothetical protein